MQPCSTTYGFSPNFYSNYSVELNHPVDQVFETFNLDHERVCRISALCSDFELLELDFLPVPNSTPVSQMSFRSLQKSQTSAAPAESTRLASRQSFKMTESVPLLLGLTKKVYLSGTITVDGMQKVTLYESISDGGIQTWKLRQFKEIDENKARITETIYGQCPALLRPIVQKEARRAHWYVGSSYLFVY